MVQSNAVVIGWNRPVTGRETMAAELFGTSMAYYEKLKSTGKIESYEPILLEVHGGDLNGFVLLRGTHAQLDAVKSSDEFREIVARAEHCIEGIGVIDGYTAAVIPQVMQVWTKAIPPR